MIYVAIFFRVDSQLPGQSYHCSVQAKEKLAHWGRMTHICVGELTIIGSDNGLSPGRRQAIIWTNAAIMLIGPLGTNFSEILNEIQTFSLEKIRLKMSYAKCCQFYLGLNVLIKKHMSKVNQNKMHYNSQGSTKTWWRHQMEKLSASLAFVRGSHQSPVNSAYKGQWGGALMYPLICAWTKNWVNNLDAGDLRRNHAHYGVTVMSVHDFRTCIICSILRWLLKSQRECYKIAYELLSPKVLTTSIYIKFFNVWKINFCIEFQLYVLKIRTNYFGCALKDVYSRNCLILKVTKYESS